MNVCSFFILYFYVDLLKHEQASVQMFHCMRKKNGLDKMMKDYELNLKKDIIFIEELIQGRKTSESPWTAKGRPEDKSFLYEIVANKLNGIDVDKWDYLSRDCHYLGIPNGFDHQRLLKSARVCEVDGRNHICFRDKVADNIYGMFHTRYTLHRQALQHKIGYIIDVKIKEALVKANDKLSPDHKISDAIDDILEYTKLTDHIFDQILNQSDSNPDLAEARSILEDVVNRRLPKFVGEARLKEKDLKEELQKQWREIITDNKYVNAEEFDIYVLDMGFGEVGKEPIDNVHFYSKNEPNKAFKLEKYQVSSLKPKRFHEYLVRVYYKKTDGSYQKIQQKAEKRFHEWCENNEFIDSEEDESVGVPSQNNQSSDKIFNDPIHGQIELHPLLVKIIDTPQFQRLRHIKQRGGAYLVYPGATHTRFEHSLGMAYLAGRMIKVLQEDQPNAVEKINQDLIDEKDVLCVQIAALCYNLGHGPFSHLYEKLHREALKREAEACSSSGDGQQQAQSEEFRSEMWKVASFWMFLDIVEKNDELKQKLNEKDLRFIKELIEGVDTADPEWPATGRSENKAFLYEIVINKWNGIDVHRWDYFARDCHHLGIPNSFDHQRLLESARVCKVNGRNHICFRDKVADNVYDMFRTQYTLYSQAYQHKIGNISQKKIIDALLEARDKLPKISPIAVSKLQDDIERKIRRITGVSSHTHEDDENSTELNREMREFTKLTDHIFEEILYSSDAGLEGARKKLEDVVKRRLPKCVGETRLIKRDNLDHKKALNQTLQNMWNKAVDEWNKLHPAVFLDKKDFSTEVIQLDCTHSTGKNPIDNVYFYRKWNLTEAFKIKKYEVSSLLPEEFTEYVGRVYYTKNSVEEEMDAKECFKWWCLGKCVIELYDQHAFKGTKC
uniref:Deoxynucleoside triphosphate triphosphohydrolase SAMHD1 n=1 Tax=Cyprinus carpio TaxID=7962 RepID=A0A8C1Z7U4_CYPCA